MKYLLALFLLTPFSCAEAQIKPGYDPAEAVDMVALCNSFTFLKEENDDSEIIPKAYEKIYDSHSIGLDNRFQVYRKEETAAIVIRGTTANPTSWMANVYSALIPADSVVMIDSVPHPYTFALVKGAAVHSGYALGVLLMSEDIVGQIRTLNTAGVRDFYITGHSQGGALATLLRAYLEYLPAETFAVQNNYKTYAFAGPMAGNAAFAAEYNKRFAENGTAFRLENPNDMVPAFPGNMREGANPVSMFGNQSGGNDMRNIFLALLFRQFSDSLSSFANRMGEMVLQQLSQNVGKIVMPQYVDDYSYRPAGEQIIVDPVAVAVKDPETGAESMSEEVYQHKPYIYYRSILLVHFPEVHEKLKRLLPPGVE